MRTFILVLCIAVVSCTPKKQVELVSQFTPGQKRLIESADQDTPMRVYKITNQQDSLLLRTQCEDVIPDPNDKTLQLCIDRIYTTVRDSMSLGVGIAAPQVGILKNIIWVQRFDKEAFPFEYYLNPKIVEYSEKKQDCREGCLSIPDRSDTTRTRAYAIKIQYDNFTTRDTVETVEGFTSVIFQHEIDHLNGILYLDHLEQDMKEDAAK